MASASCSGSSRSRSASNSAAAVDRAVLAAGGLARHEVRDALEPVERGEPRDVADALARSQQVDARQGGAIGVEKALDRRLLRGSPVACRPAEEPPVVVEELP